MIDNTTLALLLLCVWVLGNIHGAYRWGHLGEDRSLRRIWREWRRGSA